MEARSEGRLLAMSLKLPANSHEKIIERFEFYGPERTLFDRDPNVHRSLLDYVQMAQASSG